MQAEEKHVVRAELLEHLDVCAVERADRDGAVHHELHVAGAAGLLAGGRDLLGHLCGGHEHLGGGDAVVRQEVHLQPAAADGVGIHIGRERAQQLDDALGHSIAGRGLGRKQERARLEGLVRVVVQQELQLRDAHGAQKLALILVQALDLHVKDRVAVEREAVGAEHPRGQPLLVERLDLLEPGKHGGVIRRALQTRELLGVQEIAVAAEHVAHERVQAGVALGKPAAVVDAVGDIGEAAGVERADVAEEVAAQDLPVQGGDAVDGPARGKAEVCHVHAAVGNDEVAPHARIVAEAGAQVVAPAAVDLADDLPHARQLALDEALRPGLERLGHDGVVRIVDAGGNDGPCLVPAEAVVIEQQAHELGDDERRVRVVDLDDVVLGKVAHRAVARAMGAQDALRRRGDEEILLTDAQGLALDVVVRRVEHLRDDLGHRALLETLDIAAGGEEIHVEVVRAVRLPEAERIDAPVAIRGDEHVARHGQHALIAAQLAVVMAVGVPVRLDAAAEAHLDRVLMARHEPARGGRAPVVRDLGLAAVDDALPEDAQLVAQRIARGGDALGGEAVHIARGEAAETAVAKAGVRLGL